jgi:hypothetical protein
MAIDARPRPSTTEHIRLIVTGSSPFLFGGENTMGSAASTALLSRLHMAENGVIATAARQSAKELLFGFVAKETIVPAAM